MNNSAQWWTPRKPCPTSKYNKVCHCITVCWFDVSFEKKISRTGIFQVYLRIQHKHRARSQNVFNVSATVSVPEKRTEETSNEGEGERKQDEAEAAAIVSSETTTSQYNPRNNNSNWTTVNQQGWINICIGTVAIEQRNSVVRTRMWKHSSSWVRDISLDFAFLVEVER